MKKNKLFLLGLFVVFAAVLSLSLVSNTLAKYTSSATGSDTARVAKWGIVLNVTADNVLYNEDKTGNEVTGAKVTAAELAAPGTYQKLTTVSLTGTPEVSYKIIVNVDLELENWEIAEGEYCPLTFTVDNASFTKTGTIAELEVALEKAILTAITGQDASSASAGVDDYANGYTFTASYDAGEEVPASVRDGVLVDWKWAFEGENAKDTELGVKGNATINFKLSITVEQTN